jgi:hypothetical protein
MTAEPTRLHARASAIQPWTIGLAGVVLILILLVSVTI